MGWAREQREGWTIKRVRVDGTTRAEWNEDSQEPSIFYLRPGEHEVRLSAAQLSDPGNPSSRPRRRYKVRPLEIELLEGEAQLCVIRVAGEKRRRPRVSCEAYDVGGDEEEEYADEDEYGDEYADEDEYGDMTDTGDDQVASAPPEGTPPTEAVAPTTPALAPAPASSQPAASSSSSGAVPSPFGPAAAATPAPQPTSATPAPAAPPSPPPATTTPPRRLTVEERVERLERQLEEIQRLLRRQQR